MINGTIHEITFDQEWQAVDFEEFDSDEGIIQIALTQTGDQIILTKGQSLALADVLLEFGNSSNIG